MDDVSTCWRVGVYRPVGVERAIDISACGRIVSVGLGGWEASARGEGAGVIEDRRIGHCSIALESVLRRIGRYVKRVYWDDNGTGG